MKGPQKRNVIKDSNMKDRREKKNEMSEEEKQASAY